MRKVMTKIPGKGVSTKTERACRSHARRGRFFWTCRRDGSAAEASEAATNRPSHVAAARGMKLAGAALGISRRLLAEAADPAAAVNTSADVSGVTAGDHPAVAALADDPAVAEVGAVASNVQLHVVGRSDRATADADGVADRDPVGSHAEAESVAEVDAVAG